MNLLKRFYFVGILNIRILRAGFALLYKPPVKRSGHDPEGYLRAPGIT